MSSTWSPVNLAVFIQPNVIKVTNNTPCKEWFRQITLLLVKEVCTNLLEMLDLGAIHPNQIAWCNAVVLVWKKMEAYAFV